MGKEVMQNIDGISIYPIISLVLFFVVFSVIMYFTVTLKKDKADHLSSLPLENDDRYEN
ncbi:MAG: hypothetical protein KDC92_05690 [Bacteroidetes bacterium]|nr:hypothetical protein [Bacteroidota bacterium]